MKNWTLIGKLDQIKICLAIFKKQTVLFNSSVKTFMYCQILFLWVYGKYSYLKLQAFSCQNFDKSWNFTFLDSAMDNSSVKFLLKHEKRNPSPQLNEHIKNSKCAKFGREMLKDG